MRELASVAFIAMTTRDEVKRKKIELMFDVIVLMSEVVFSFLAISKPELSVDGIVGVFSWRSSLTNQTNMI